MKRMLSLILCAVLVLGLTGCQKKEKNPFAASGDFRNVAWGMTIDEVKELETAEVLEEVRDAIVYEDQVGNYTEVCVLYSFHQNQLTQGSYIFAEDHEDESLYIADFDQVKAKLNDVYGKPETDGSKWTDEPDGLVPEEQLGSMVAKGNLTYFVQWETDTEDIILGLYGSKGKVSMILNYKSIEFAELEKSYEADTTGYQPARDYQLYVDNPDGYEGEFIYIKGTLRSTDIEEALVFQDENLNPWLGVLTYPLSNREILQEGDEVTLFGQVIKWAPMEHATSLMVFKIDKDGEILHARGALGSTFEELFFTQKKMQ